jgi:serine/threonine-protein kinase RsbW
MVRFLGEYYIVELALELVSEMSKEAFPQSAIECTFSKSYEAELSLIGIIRNDVLSLNEYQSLDDEKRDSLIIIITEMMTNAIKHGSHGINDAHVRIGISKLDHSVICIFEDSGPGFNRSNIPDPTLPEYIHREHGRGIFITEHLAEAVQYVYDDNTMRIIVKL